jgi:hypothetical protein
VLALPLPPRDTAFRFSVPTCASGMEPVMEAFKGLFEQGHNLEAQLCIYSKGQKVLDAAGCARANSTYDTTTLQNCLSCTKVVTAIAVARLVERWVDSTHPTPFAPCTRIRGFRGCARVAHLRRFVSGVCGPARRQRGRNVHDSLVWVRLVTWPGVRCSTPTWW